MKNTFSFSSNKYLFRITFKNNLGISVLELKSNLDNLIYLADSIFQYTTSDMISDLFYFNANEYMKSYVFSFASTYYNSEIIEINIYENIQDELFPRIKFFVDYNFMDEFLYSICSLLSNIYNIRDIFLNDDILDYLGFE